MVRKAKEKDIERILELLLQTGRVHNELRPDMFKASATKYSKDELRALINDENTPIFVFDDGEVRGYMMCKVSEVKGKLVLVDMKTLYIDDVCVDEQVRGRHIGKAIYDHVVRYAKSIGCYNVTLNVWEGNDRARRFYESMGMRVQKTTMEVIL